MLDALPVQLAETGLFNKGLFTNKVYELEHR